MGDCESVISGSCVSSGVGVTKSVGISVIGKRFDNVVVNTGEPSDNGVVKSGENSSVDSKNTTVSGAKSSLGTDRLGVIDGVGSRINKISVLVGTLFSCSEMVAGIDGGVDS